MKKITKLTIWLVALQLISTQSMTLASTSARSADQLAEEAMEVPTEELSRLLNEIESTGVVTDLTL